MAEAAASQQCNPSTGKNKEELSCAMKCDLILHKSSFAAQFCPERAAGRREQTIRSLWEGQQLAGPCELQARLFSDRADDFCLWS